MNTRTRRTLRNAACWLTLALLGLFGGSGRSAARALPAPLPASTCSLVGTTRTCELWAKTGTLAVTGTVTVAIWGYSATSGGAASVPGPTIIANEGETLEIVLHNSLSQATALALPGLDGPPDLAGVAAGGSKTYSFNLAQPGTLLYEAGLTTNGARQVAMGLFGGLIVRPASNPNTVYNGGSAFDDEALVIISEIDPSFNASPTTFKLHTFAPKYWLLNGESFPNTDPIASSPGNTLALRLINAGLKNHALGVLGLGQQVIGTDGIPLAQPYAVVAETLAAGQTLDTLIRIAPAAPLGSKYALYDPAFGRSGATTTTSFSGMLTFIELAPDTPGGDTLGPVASGLSVTPASTNGSVAVALAATISDVASGNSALTQAEYFVDSLGAAGAGLAMAATDGTFDTSSEAVNASLSVAQLGALASGDHTLYVRGRDAAGNWGAVGAVVLRLDKAGPGISAASLTPAATNSSAVAIQATASDVASGNANVAAAEYFVDVAGANGSGTALTLNQVSPIASLTGSLSAASVAGLSQGPHTITVHARDSWGNWGAFSNLALTIDRTAPSASGVTLTPNPNNGTLSYPGTVPSAVRVAATLSDPLAGGVNTRIQRAESFIDSVGAPGTGLTFIASDGSFNNAIEVGYANIPLATINALSAGPHTLAVRGQDGAGNWGPVTSITIVIDKTSPALSSIAVAPNPSAGASSIVLTATATDPANGAAPGSPIVAAEWFEGAAPAPGSGNPMIASDGGFNSSSEGIKATISTSGMTIGAHTLSLRSKDAAGNWSSVGSVNVTIQLPNAIFANGFEGGNLAAWSATSGAAQLSVNAAAALTGSFGMRATIAGNTPGYVVDNTPANDASYNARFEFHPNGTSTNASQHSILVGRSAANANVFQVQYRRTGGSTYQIRAVVTRSGGTTATSWYPITNAKHAIEISWASGGSASFRLYIDGALKQTLTGLNTSALTLDAVRLGPSAGLATGMSGSEYFDTFVSTRYTYIGP